MSVDETADDDAAPLRFCKPCRRMLPPDRFWSKQTRCRDCDAERKRVAQRADPARYAAKSRRQRARAKLRQQVARTALWHMVSEIRDIAADFAPELDTDRADEFRDRLTGLLVAGVAVAEDELNLPAGSALKIIAAQRNPPQR